MLREVSFGWMGGGVKIGGESRQCAARMRPSTLDAPGTVAAFEGGIGPLGGLIC